MNTDSSRNPGRTPDLATYRVTGYSTGAGTIKRLAWYLVNVLLFMNPLFPFYAPKRQILRIFGATIGQGVIIKPRVSIKYPWRLSIGKNSWVGEGVWIDNLAQVTIGENACVSQDAYLLTGNHDYKKVGFDLITRPIVLDDGTWVGARATVCPGVTLERNAILTVGSVLTRNAESNGIYSGNPAKWVRRRSIG